MRTLSQSGRSAIATIAAKLSESMKMRIGLLLVFWVCVLSTIVRVPLLCYEFWLLATEVTFFELSGWALLTEHLPFLSWLADLIVTILGAEFGRMILDWPATVFTIYKLILGTLIGIWAFDRLHEMDDSHELARPLQPSG